MLMAKTNKARSKYPAMITYIIAVLALLAGLLLPLSTRELAAGGIQFNNMPILQLSGALVALGVTGKLQFGTALSPAFSFKTPLGGSLDIGAILLLAYIFITAFALIMLILVCVAKKHKTFVRKLVMVTEIIALAVLLAFVVCELIKYDGDWNLSVIIPFAVTLLMLIIQSVIYLKGSGVVKAVAFILSAVGIVAAVGNITAMFPAAASQIDKFFANFNVIRPFRPSLGLYTLGETGYFGHTLLTDSSLIIPSVNPAYAVVNISALILIALVCLDLVLNLFGLGKHTGKGMLKFNVIRYSIEFLLLLVMYGFIFWLMGDFGFSLYLLTAVTLTQLIIAIVRLNYEKKSAYAYDESESVADLNEERAITPADDGKPAAVESTQPAAITATGSYSGPTDAFLQKLNNEQKSEFVKTFLEHGSCNIDGIPDYVVGGDNSKFFSLIFIYLSRVRDLISDGLMDKLYEEVNLLT